MRYRKFYPTVDTLMRSAAVDTLAQIFNDCHYFDGTLTYVDSDGNAVPYPDLGFDPEDLFLYWSSEFERVQVGFGLYTCPFDVSESDLISIASKVRIKAENFLKLNKIKYLGLVKTYGLQYDPISNYDMVEQSGDARKEGKAESTNSIKGGIVTDVDAPETEQKSYTTTYDDVSDTRLAGRAVNEYSGTYRVDESSVPIKRTVQRAEHENDGSTTTLERTSSETLTWDEITTPSAHEVETHKLIRRGNIGTTTTQEMIEAERELARQNILEEFFKDFNKHVLLGSWRV